MKKTLSRDLGIFSLISIACGAMVSGLLVLPGYAAGMTGPSVYLAFLLAGILFLPATLSKCEMATALPESGGDYLFIDRSLGPFFSTISGLGMFFTLVMKSAFALAGFGAYLVLIVPLGPEFARIAGVAIAGLIILINYRGAKKSGTVQQVLFLMTVFALMWFLGKGSLGVYHENLNPSMTGGWTGFFTATAFVFVSYAGVTKIASVAEEVKDPGRMIPVGMLVSLGVMIFLYVTVVYVMVGNVPVSDFLELKKFKDAPLALAGREVAGQWGLFFLAGISALALTGMANAGVLASSRYPFALSRYKQLPDFINRIHPSFSTPSVSILLTGMLLILSITFLPVVQLAKLASAFKLIVLGMLNCALIILRESDIEWYQPEFRSPLYPFVQLFGIGASLFLIFFLGISSILSSLGLILFAAGWYYFYVRRRVDRKGAIFQSAGTDSEDRDLFDQARSPSRRKKESVIVPFFELEDVEPLKIERRLRLAASLCAEGERLDVVDFIEISEQSLLSEYEMDEKELEILEERASLLEDEIENSIHVDQVITHNSRGALLNYAREENPHWVVFDWKEPSPWQILIGIQKWWLEDLPCDAMFFQDNDVIDFEDIGVVVEPGPYDGEVLYAAEHIAEYFQGNITFLNSVREGDETQRDFIESYQAELQELIDGNPETEIIPENKWDETLIERSAEFDFLLIGGRQDDSFFEYDQLIKKKTRQELVCNYARVRSNLETTESILESDEKKEIDIVKTLKDSGSFMRAEVDDKDELFGRISDSFSSDMNGQVNLEEALWERESLQNTFIENGVAFPHAISDNIQKTHFRIVILDEPVSYTDDGEQVHLCGVTIGPSDDREKHLKIIRKLSRVFINDDLQNELNDVQDYPDTLEILSRYI